MHRPEECTCEASLITSVVVRCSTRISRWCLPPWEATCIDTGPGIWTYWGASSSVLSSATFGPPFSFLSRAMVLWLKSLLPRLYQTFRISASMFRLCAFTFREVNRHVIVFLVVILTIKHTVCWTLSNLTAGYTDFFVSRASQKYSAEAIGMKSELSFLDRLSNALYISLGLTFCSHLHLSLIEVIFTANAEWLRHWHSTGMPICFIYILFE